MYMGIFQEQGNEVNSEDAFRYALERIANGTPEERKEFEEWYYSGNWIEKEEDHAN